MPFQRPEGFSTVICRRRRAGGLEASSRKLEDSSFSRCKRRLADEPVGSSQTLVSFLVVIQRRCPADVRKASFQNIEDYESLKPPHFPGLHEPMKTKILIEARLPSDKEYTIGHVVGHL
jgi:hypothetical protein